MKQDRIPELTLDCSKCYGFCCVALYFSKTEGFPSDKPAGKPCSHLMQDFSCDIHQSLMKKGLKGCLAYDCFGAGQKVAEVYPGVNWRSKDVQAEEMYAVFLIMRQLYERIWYLTSSLEHELPKPLSKALIEMVEATVNMSNLGLEAILKLDLELHRASVNQLLKQSSDLIRARHATDKAENSKGENGKITLPPKRDYIGMNLSKYELRGADFRGALLIASNLQKTDLRGADLIAADLRDADLRGADLTNTLNLTQGQINTARGDDSTKLPSRLRKPFYWASLKML